MATTRQQPRDLRSTLVHQAVSATHWYAVIDAAQDNSVPQRAAESGLRVECLYAHGKGPSLDSVAPHLAAFDPAGDFATWLFHHWGGNHAILLQSAAPFDELVRHFRRFLLVKGPENQRYRFRFYDPRILRAFLPVCTPKELEDFFGPVACYYAAGRFANSVWGYRWAGKSLAARQHPVQREAAGGSEGAAPPPEQTGTLTVVVVDARSRQPIQGASVQVAGPAMQEAISGAWGETPFAQIPVGLYDIFAIDSQYRMGSQKAELDVGGARVELPCSAARTAE